MTRLSPALRWRTLAAVAGVAIATSWLALTGTAEAVSDLQIPRIDCQGHPRKIAIENLGDSAQDLAGWKLQSDKPGEEFDLSPIGTLGSGATVYVFNGGGSPETPVLAGNDWIYPWNAGSPDYALWEDGSDFIQLNNPAGSTVSYLPCPIPPVAPSPSPTPEPAPQPPLVEDSAGTVSTANAASNLQIPDQGLDCLGHPRKIAIRNIGDSAQDLNGWKLVSDKPGEEFPLSDAHPVAAGETFYVFNGHMAPLVPYQIGGQWIYGWNPSETLIESLFVLWEDGYDFVAIVDAGGNEVFRKACPIPFGWTPTPQPTQAPPPTSGNTDATNTPGPTQTDGVVQDVPGRSTTAAARVAQARGPATSGEQFGPPLPASDSGIPSGGGPPLHKTSLALVLMSLFGGAAVTLGGLYLVGQAIRRPGRNA